MKNMTLARWIIVFSIIGSGALAWFGWKLRTERLVLQDALKSGEVQELSQGMLVKARQHTQLYKEYESTGTGPQDNLKSYIVRRARLDKVSLGNVNLTTKNADLRGAIDKKVRIDPQNDGGVGRTQVANFLFYLEEGSRRLYVTSVELEPEQKRLKEHEEMLDSWIWNAEITVRQKKDE